MSDLLKTSIAQAIRRNLKYRWIKIGEGANEDCMPPSNYACSAELSDAVDAVIKVVMSLSRECPQSLTQPQSNNPEASGDVEEFIPKYKFQGDGYIFENIKDMPPISDLETPKEIGIVELVARALCTEEGKDYDCISSASKGIWQDRAKAAISAMQQTASVGDKK